MCSQRKPEDKRSVTPHVRIQSIPETKWIINAMCACVGLCKGEFQCFLNLGHMSSTTILAVRMRWMNDTDTRKTCEYVGLKVLTPAGTWICNSYFIRREMTVLVDLTRKHGYNTFSSPSVTVYLLLHPNSHFLKHFVSIQFGWCLHL